MANDNRHINFDLMRRYILDQQDSTPGAKKYWRSLEELADSPAFRELVAREYPQQAQCWDDPVERRTFLKLMGASLALAGLSGCVYQAPEKVVPYVKQPEEVVPGIPLFFATAFSLGGVATPLLARSNEGRPTKVEGNPDHPNNRRDANDPGSSATDIYSQASILTLYDPDRSQTTLYRDEPRPWSAFVDAIRGALDEQGSKQGSGLRFLTETVSSPTLVAQIKQIVTEFPQAKWHQYEPVNNDNARNGAMLAFGQPLHSLYDFSKADRILSIDSDFLRALPGTLRYARDFAARRRQAGTANEMNRLYVVESTPTNTGAMADHCWRFRPSQIEGFTRFLAGRFGVSAPAANAYSSRDESWATREIRWINAIVSDLQAHKGTSIVIPGRESSSTVHALAHTINDRLGNTGKTVFYTDPPEGDAIDQRQSLQDLVNDIDNGRVEILVILGGNPAYTTPSDLKLDQTRLFKVSKLRVHLSLHRDETSELCHWHVPETHYMEAWSDARSYDGTVSIVQPLIEPLYQNKSPHEFLAVFTPQYDRRSYDLVRDYWQAQAPTGKSEATPPQQPPARNAPNPNLPQSNVISPLSTPPPQFEVSWRKWVHDGFIPNTAFVPRSVTVKPDWANQAAAVSSQPPAVEHFEIVIRPDPSIFDGRFANNGWLQELPKPLTKLTWDNAAMISPRTASVLGIRNEIGKKGGDIYADVLRISRRGVVIGPIGAWITPGQPDNVITIHLGHGRRLAGRVGNQHGINLYDFRTSDSPWFIVGVNAQKASGFHEFATTQLHYNLEDYNFSRKDRDIVRSQPIEEFLAGKKETGESEAPDRHETLYPNYDYQNQGNGLNYAWGMALDLNNCIGCNACTIACQAENNIPVVGQPEVARSREMHWIRVDTYFKGPDANRPEAIQFMPVPCMHCENAPCEPVCPVHATVHSAEGTNDMVYNRCVGTKYCSNNCPYKVRRFNFFLYQDWDTPTYQLMRNPDVSVRSRGVMEKCTYCIQRIQAAKIQSEIEGRRVRDGEIVTACQAVCPTDVIVFGDVNDPNSSVSKLKADQRNYSLLGELNTRPRTTYLAKLTNPNSEIRE